MGLVIKAVGRAAGLALVWQLAACSLSPFDGSRAWSDSQSVPDGVGSSDFGVVVTSVANDMPGARIVVYGDDPPSVSMLTYDRLGESTIAGTEIERLTEELPEVVGAQDPLQDIVAPFTVSDLGRILLFDGAGDEGPELLTTLGDEACLDADAHVGRAMVFGLFVGREEEVDLVASSGADLVIFPDLDAEAPMHECSRCRLAGDGGAVLAAARADLDGDELDELVATYADADGAGRLIVLDADEIIGQDGGDCLERDPRVGPLEAPSDDADFGSRLAVGSAVEEDVVDAVVASPSSGYVYVFTELIEQSPPGEAVVIDAVSDSREFGADLVLIDLDGDEIDEIVVGDPGADSGGETDAGAAYVYGYGEGDQTPDSVATVFDSSPEPGQRFGRSLALAEFVSAPPDQDLLTVGAASEVFVYFRSIADGEDPRPRAVAENALESGALDVE